MRKTILISLLLVLAFSGFSQHQGGELTLNISGFSNDTEQQVYPVFYEELYGSSSVAIDYHNPLKLYGITYKNTFSNNSGIRLGLSYGARQENHTRPAYDYTNTEYKMHQYRFSAGYEWRKSIGEESYFSFGLDLTYDRQKQELDSEYLSSDYSQTGEEELILDGFGVNPFMGINYKLTKKITLSAEAALVIKELSGENTGDYAYYDKQYSSNSWSNVFKENVEYKYTTLSPVNNISISYTF